MHPSHHLAVLKKVVEVTFDTEEFKQLYDEAKRLDELTFRNAIHKHWGIFHPMHYLVKGIRHFTNISPKDIKTGDNRTTGLYTVSMQQNVCVLVDVSVPRTK